MTSTEHATSFPDPELASWLRGQLGAGCQLDRLTGDVSPRVYFRARRRDGGTAILATYPREMAATYQRFRRTTELLQSVAVRVPEVLAVDAEARWMLLEDLGPATVFESAACPWSAWQPLFRTALAVAERIHQVPLAAVTSLSPALDEALLLRELEQTWETFLRPGGLGQDPGLERDLADLLAFVCAQVAGQAQVSCHRDFMVRNLVLCPGQHGDAASGLAVLDHQDLRSGPRAYDLASLLNDSLFPPPWLELELLATVSPRISERDYRLAAVQRTLKAVGTYAAFARRGSDRHLPLIPPTLERALHHLAALPEGQDLAEPLRRRWLPGAAPT